MASIICYRMSKRDRPIKGRTVWRYLNNVTALSIGLSLLTLTTVAGVKRLAASVYVIMCVCVCDCVFVCPHDKTKTAETKITKLGTGLVHHESSHSN